MPFLHDPFKCNFVSQGNLRAAQIVCSSSDDLVTLKKSILDKQTVVLLDI